MAWSCSAPVYNTHLCFWAGVTACLGPELLLTLGSEEGAGGGVRMLTLLTLSPPGSTLNFGHISWLSCQLLKFAAHFCLQLVIYFVEFLKTC